MGGISIIRDMVAHTFGQSEGSSVAELAHELAFQYKQDMATVAPVVRRIAWRIFHHSNAEVPSLDRAPNCLAGLSSVPGVRPRVPIG